MKVKLVRWTRSSTAFKTFSSIEDRLKKKLITLIILQFITNFLDLIGVIAVGVLSSIALFDLETINIANLSINTQNWPKTSTQILLGIIILTLTLKTLVSGLSTRSILYLLGEKYSAVSATLISQLIRNPSSQTLVRTKQENLYICTRGVEALYLQVLAPSLNMIADINLLLILLAGTFMINPEMTLIFTIFFGLFGAFLGKRLSAKIKTLGFEYATLNIKSNEKIIESLNLQREIVLLGMHEEFIQSILLQRKRLAKVLAESMFIPFITKYLVEIAVILGACIAGLTSIFLTSDKSFLVALTIFLAVATRLTPALLRIQQSVLQIKNNLDVAEMAFELVNLTTVQAGTTINPSRVASMKIDGDFESNIIVRNLQFKYTDTRILISGLTCEIEKGNLVAVVGPSGSGKSTLVNLFSGFLTNFEGDILVSGLTPELAVERWPGKLALVPQDISLISGTVAENVALGLDHGDIDRARVLRLLSDCALEEHINSLPMGIDTVIGESGITLSGGQRQRLGIARALYSKPEILFLDEATSALDGATEEWITDKLFNNLDGITIVVVAHRLSTIQKATKLIYLEVGAPPLVGNFSQIRELSPNFETQAQILGL